MPEKVQILSLHAENIKTIEVVDIDFDGRIHKVAGDIGQGKTAILEGIKSALDGVVTEKSKDPTRTAIIRKGADQARLELRLSDAVIQKVLNRDGDDRIFVNGLNGEAMEEAAAYVRMLFGASNLDPIAFALLSGGTKKGRTVRAREQRNMILQAIPDQALKLATLRKGIIKELGEGYAEALGEISMDRVDFTLPAFTIAEQMESATVDHRKTVNAQVETYTQHLKRYPAPDAPAPKADLATCKKLESEAGEAYHRANAKQEQWGQLQQRRQDLRQRIETDADQVQPLAALEKERKKTQKATTTLEEQAEALRKQLAEAEQQLAQSRNRAAEVDRAITQAEQHQQRIEDLAALDAELGEEADTTDPEALKAAWAEAIQATQLREQQDLHDEALANLQAAQTSAERYDALVKFFRDTVPAALLNKGNLKIEGLTVEDGELVVNDVPLYQLSTSEQIRIGMRIAAAVNPKVGFLLIDRAESLGRTGLQAVAEIAEELDLQLIMTTVDPDAQPGPGVTVMQEGAAH